MNILTVAEMQNLLSKVTYKEGYKMRIYDGHTEGPMWELIAEVDDSVNKGQKAQLEVYSPIQPQISALSFYFWLFDRLKRIEIHEHCEFFKIDGVCFIDPHAPMADRNLLFDQVI